MSQTQDTIHVLNDLIETSKDGQYGFQQCADRAESLQLKADFRKRAQQCEGSVRELQDLVLRYDGKPEDSGTLRGAVHRGWVSVKSAVTSDTDHSLLEECERGEDTALARYRKALKADLPGDVTLAVQRQMTGVQRNHDEIKSLRDATAPH